MIISYEIRFEKTYIGFNIVHGCKNLTGDKVYYYNFKEEFIDKSTKKWNNGLCAEPNEKYSHFKIYVDLDVFETPEIDTIIHKAHRIILRKKKIDRINEI